MQLENLLYVCFTRLHLIVEDGESLLEFLPQLLDLAELLPYGQHEVD